MRKVFFVGGDGECVLYWEIEFAEGTGQLIVIVHE